MKVAFVAVSARARRMAHRSGRPGARPSRGSTASMSVTTNTPRTAMISPGGSARVSVLTAASLTQKAAIPPSTRPAALRFWLADVGGAAARPAASATGVAAPARQQRLGPVRRVALLRAGLRPGDAAGRRGRRAGGGGGSDGGGGEGWRPRLRVGGPDPG